jgi:radical SAM protein with 4Fe4S-binding SPASM domain
VELIEQAKAIDARVTSSVQKYGQMDGDGRTERCYGAMFETAIAADAKVYACCHHKGNPEWAIGDLNTERFRDVWTRHIGLTAINTDASCPAFCRHCGTNQLFELTIDKPVTHRNFI